MNKKIVVVEDDRDILEIISQLLQDEGYDVTSYNNGDVIDLIKNNKPDLILCDNWLPSHRGNEICKQLKADPDTSNIPFILISTSMHLADIAHACGADSYMQKPFNIKEVTSIVKSYL